MNRVQAGEQLEALFRGLVVAEQVAAVGSLDLAECRLLATLLGISAQDSAEVDLHVEPAFLLSFQPLAALLRRLSPGDHAEPPAAARGSLVLDPRLKVAVMAARVEAGLSLWHPDDLLQRDVDVDLARAFGGGDLRKG